MNFVQELKHCEKTEEEIRAEEEAALKAGIMLKAVKQACQEANENKTRRISGYVHFLNSADSEAEKLAEFVERIPSHTCGGFKRREDPISVGEGTLHQQFYEDYCVGEDPQMAAMVKWKLIEGIRELGFTNYSIQIQTVRFRKTPSRLYALKIEIIW